MFIYTRHNRKTRQIQSAFLKILKEKLRPREGLTGHMGGGQGRGL